MTDGQTTFTIADEAIARAKGVVTYDSTIQADGVSIDLTFGSSTQNYPIDPFDLFLLPAEYTRDAPLQEQSSSSSDFVPFSIKVATGSKVYLNNED